MARSWEKVNWSKWRAISRLRSCAGETPDRLLAITMPSPAAQLPPANTPFLAYVEVLIALGAVLLLAYITLRLGLPRILGMRTAAGGPIQVLARYPLEP